MSDSIEITEVEITNSPLSLKDISSPFVDPKKRQLELEDEEESERFSKYPKIEENEEEEKKLTEDEQKPEETVVEEETVIESDTVVEIEESFEETNILEQNISEKEVVEEEEEVSEEMLEELPSQEVVEEVEFNDSSSDSSEDEDDDALMARALEASTEKPTDDTEPIALDDSDEDEQDFSMDHSNVIEESEDEADEEDDRPKPKIHIVLARRLLKKSLKIARRKRVVVEEKKEEEVEAAPEVVPAPEEEKVEPPANEEVKTNEVDEMMEVEEEKIPEKENSDKNSEAEENSNKNHVGDEKEEPEKQIEDTSTLLDEITNSSIEEVFTRYVLKPPADSQPPSLDEFSEELFFCLQKNKLEIEKAAQLWNEKLHVKYKIRELMETVRRHRAVLEIETFGYKQPNNKQASSKSSTTTNSEADLHEKQQFRMSSESVSRLIQDVRASMLKREEKPDEQQWNNNSQVPQGRQGQIINVQSIINDFRQKNPQEIPRRGRRLKNSFGFESQQLEDSRGGTTSSNNSHDFSSSTKLAHHPEVSLHPVHSLYKNLANNSGSSGSGYSGQKSSLLQSILTKQSTKSPVGAGFHHQNNALPSTSTLARLLTAPERIQGAKHLIPPRQSTSKVHHNGEITITPIAHNNNNNSSNNRSKDFSMDEEDNSMEPPLVIDETEDLSFDIGERSMNKATSVSDLLCQGCKKNKAFFMCAGCSRQWYCSKECQELAWDLHAESCMI